MTTRRQSIAKPPMEDSYGRLHMNIDVCEIKQVVNILHMTADDSMRARFPKREKMKRTPIKHYECHRCGGSHPFNIYCPNVRDPPVIPGECKSFGTTTREHANDCQYVAIKDNIGLCTYCQAQDHRYADCPQRALDQEAVVRETRKNKKNKKRGKVKIVAGIMTREQESDSTLSPEKEEGGVGTQSL